MKKSIGLIGAMIEEVELILLQLEQKHSQTNSGIQFHSGIFRGKQVVVCKSGVGKVNAAVCTQILIDTFKVQYVIFTGIAGALHPSLNIGDIVVSTDCMQHDMDVSALGFARGIIPFESKSVFIADDTLRELAVNASKKISQCKTIQGRILSGDQFIANKDKVQQLYEEMNGSCTEMEGAAVAQVCSMNDTAFVIIRSMSDKADGSAHINFDEFTTLASKHSFLIVEEMLEQLHL